MAGPTSSHGPPRSPIEPALFRPTPIHDGDEVRLALTFPDGSTGELIYPAVLRLEEMGIQPDVTVTWHGRWLLSPAVFRHGGPDSRLLDEEPGPVLLSDAGGTHAAVWSSAQSPPGYENRNVNRWLVFTLPSWTVHVPIPDRISPEQLLQAIHPHETDDRFVVLRTQPPASLSEISGEGGGPELSLGDHEPVEGGVRPDPSERYIVLRPDECSNEVRHVGSRFGAACLAGGHVYLGITSFAASGDRDFVEAVVAGVRVENFRPAD